MLSYSEENKSCLVKTTLIQPLIGFQNAITMLMERTEIQRGNNVPRQRFKLQNFKVSTFCITFKNRANEAS